MASSEVLSQTLFSITKLKLAQLDKQKNAYENGKRTLLDEATADTDDAKRARNLITGAKKLPSMTSLSDNPLVSLENLDRFIQQAQYDPSVTGSFVRECEASLRKQLDVQSTRYAYASLYGRLVNEWISKGKNNETDGEARSQSAGREEARVQKTTWEEYVFEPKQTDEAAIKAYLTDVFESDPAAKAKLDCTKMEIRRFQDRWDNEECFSVESLRWTIKGMLRGDILTDVKRATLNDFLDNDVVLLEIADVLNMRMKTRETWNWEGDLVIDQRRNLNGRYRFYPDEDLLQSIFMHNIGTRWGVELRRHFSDFQQSVWKSDMQSIDEDARRRLEYFKVLGPGRRVQRGSMSDIKLNHFVNEIFLDHWPRDLDEQRDAYGSTRGAEEGDSRQSHNDVMQKLLRMIEADILLQNHLGKDVTVIRSDFKWFGPSVPHSSIVAVLEFFGVNKSWVSFFTKVLEAPMRLKQDPDDAPSRRRRRGTPISTPLADVFGEILLVCLDFAVNQKADGARLYRLHDDMWLWGDHSGCGKSWNVVTDFADVVGLDFNLEKTGSVTIPSSSQGTGKHSYTDGREDDSENGSRSPECQSLPQGDVTWGFLKLDSGSGRFVIDQEEVGKHIDELRVQLNACDSIFDWAQAWNLYGVRFFTSNFGKPAQCKSRQHVDSMLQTFRRIQEQLFPDTPGGAGERLKQMIAERFEIPVSEIPDGYIYYPMQLGGLGLKNPFVDLCLIRDGVPENPNIIIDKVSEWEDQDFSNAQTAFENSRPFSSNHEWGNHEWGNHDWGNHEWGDSRMDFSRPSEILSFMSREEWTRHRERISVSLGQAFRELMMEPRPIHVKLRGEVRAVLDEEEWDRMSEYDQWTVILYHRDMVAKFGGVNVVEKGLLPMGLMNMLQQSKFKWVG